MDSERYLFIIDLETGKTGRYVNSMSGSTDFREYNITSLGKCGVFEKPSGVIYLAGRSRCASKIWAMTLEDRSRQPQVPWVAFRGVSEKEAASVAWEWLSRKENEQ